MVFDKSDHDHALFSALDTTSIFGTDENLTLRKIDFARRSSRDWSDVTEAVETVITTDSVSDIALTTNMCTTLVEEDPIEKKVHAYLARVAELRMYLAQEGNVLDYRSEIDFWLFVLKEFNIRKGSVIATDDSNLRVVWKNEHGTFLGLQFLGGDEVQFVFFKQRAATKLTSRVAGRDTIEGVKNLIALYNLGTLLYE